MMQSYQGASKVLYVGNLDKRCTEEFLKQVFGKIAPVERCKMITDHTGSDPYCFVEFQDHESAKNALDTMNGRRVFDQDIKVNWATSNTGMRKDTSSHFHIFVGDLPEDMTTDNLKCCFDKFGTISDARVVCDVASGLSKGYGFVSFVNKINAENAIKEMQGKTLNGKQIRTNWASRKPQPPQGTVKKLDFDEVVQRSSSSNATVYVGNLPEYITEDQLTDFFKNYGTIVNIRVLRDKGYAFISFGDHNQAANAICAMHGENLQGCVLRCSWGKEQVPSNYFQQQQQQVMYTPHAGGYYGAAAQQQSQQQQQYQQQQQWAAAGQYMQMPNYYYTQQMQGYPGYAGAGGQPMSGSGQPGPNGVQNSSSQGGGYSMQ